MHDNGTRSASVEALKALKAFPAAVNGQQRWLIWLEPNPDNVGERSLRVEVKVGISADVDGVNHYRLSGALHKRPVAGWGFDSYHYEGESQLASTRIGTQGATVQSDFVWTVSQLFRYNSRLPLVVYMPAHLLLSYRILAPITEYNPVSIG